MNILRRINLLLLAIASTSLFAGPVSKEAALQKAQQFMPSKKFSETKSMARSKTAKGQDAYYIFNADNGGFVIVSGDDRTAPILGYSKTETLVTMFAGAND